MLLTVDSVSLLLLAVCWKAALRIDKPCQCSCFGILAARGDKKELPCGYAVPWGAESMIDTLCQSNMAGHPQSVCGIYVHSVQWFSHCSFDCRRICQTWMIVGPKWPGWEVKPFEMIVTYCYRVLPVIHIYIYIYICWMGHEVNQRVALDGSLR